MQNPASDEAQPPAVQAQASAQATEVSLDVCETLFSLSFVLCFFLILECFVLFRFYASVLFLSALLLLLSLFMRFLRAMHSVIYLYVVCPALNVLPFLFVGFAGNFF